LHFGEQIFILIFILAWTALSIPLYSMFPSDAKLDIYFFTVIKGKGF